MKTPRPVQALFAICSPPQLGPTRSAAIFSDGTDRSFESLALISSDFAVSTSVIWMRRPPLPSFWTMAWCPEASVARSSASETDTLVFGVVKTAPPLNSMPMFRPLTARPTMAVMVIRTETPYQILRLPMKS